MKTGKVLEVWENVNVILFSFASDWWRGWCEFSGPITEQSLVKNQSRLLLTVNWKLFKICVGQKLATFAMMLWLTLSLPHKSCSHIQTVFLFVGWLPCFSLFSCLTWQLAHQFPSMQGSYNKAWSGASI